MKTIIESYVNTTRNDFERLVDWIQIAFTSNHIFVGTNTNFDVTVDDNDTVTIEVRSFVSSLLLTDFGMIVNGYCQCEMNSFDCFGINYIYIYLNK
jgi:hypothetical protein